MWGARDIAVADLNQDTLQDLVSTTSDGDIALMVKMDGMGFEIFLV